MTSDDKPLHGPMLHQIYAMWHHLATMSYWPPTSDEMEKTIWYLWYKEPPLNRVLVPTAEKWLNDLEMESLCIQHIICIANGFFFALMSNFIHMKIRNAIIHPHHNGIDDINKLPLKEWTTNYTIPDSKVHVAHMGSTWVLSAPGGPHVGPINLAIRDA